MNCKDSLNSKQQERVHYFARQLITADDLTQDQNYQREKHRLHNRLLHGWGIICGLEIKVLDASKPLIITICSGYALSPQGDEIFVPTEFQFDLGKCFAGQDASCHSCAPAMSGAVDPAKDYFIAIRYIECKSRPVRVPPVGCGCDDTGCEFSRIRDGFEVTCIDKLPDSHDAESHVLVDLCSIVNNTKVVACPQCPSDPWIVLAKVYEKGNLLNPPSPGDRRILLTTVVMQEHLQMQCV